MWRNILEHALLSSLSKCSLRAQGQGTMLGAGVSANVTACISFLITVIKIATNSVQIYYRFVDQSFNLSITWLKSRCCQGFLILGVSDGESISLPFPACRDYLYSLAHGLLPLFSKPATES